MTSIYFIRKPLLSNKTLSRFVRGSIAVFKWIKFGLPGESFKSFSNNYIFTYFFSLLFSTFEFLIALK